MSSGVRIPLDPELSWTVIVTVAESVLNLNWGARRAATSTLKAISGKSNRHKSQMNWNYTKSPIKSWTATQATSKQSSTFDFALPLSVSPSLDKFSCTTKKKSRNKIRPGQFCFLAKGRPGERQTERGRGRFRASLRIMERQLASGFCSVIEAITLHYADGEAEGKRGKWKLNISIWIEQQLSRQKAKENCRRRKRERCEVRQMKYENQTGFHWHLSWLRRGKKAGRWGVVWPRLHS